MVARSDTHPGSSTLIVALFFLSGLSSLVLETVWVRMMVLTFGSTTFAVSTVLTAFMGGLALGSWIAGRQAHRLRSPRRAVLTYGLLELGIGTYALGMPWLAGELPALHSALWGTAHTSYYTFAVLRFLLAGALLLAPTFAMGATLPILARYFCGRGAPAESTGRRIGFLYAINTFGAVAGVVLAGFVLLPAIGMWATNTAACVLDLVLALAALVLFFRSSQSPATAEPATEPAPPGSASPLLMRLSLAGIFASGAVAMTYEVAWTRVLSMIIGSSTYAFSLILASFLVGLAAGSAIYARRQAGQPDQPRNIALIHILVAVTAGVGLMLMDRLPILMLALMQWLSPAPHTMVLIKLALAGLIIFWPTFFMGMIFPAVICICAGAGRGAARTTGDVYSANTLGAILGSFASGFLLIPLLGLQRTLAAMVITSLALAALFGLLSASRRHRLLLPLTALGGVVIMCLVLRPWNLEVLTSGVFRVSRYEDVISSSGPKGASGDHHSSSSSPARQAEERWLERARRALPPGHSIDTYHEPMAGYKVVSHREGVTTTVSMARTVDHALSWGSCWVRHTLLVNGKPDASLSVLHQRPLQGCPALLERLPPGSHLRVSAGGDAETQILSGLLPVLLFHQDRPPKNGLVIGWGSGITVGAALQSGLKRLVAVELESAVIEAARVYEPHNHAPQLDPRVEVINADGRNYLASTREVFDIIISEPSNPWMAGCGNLFTTEFFRIVKERLAPGGVFLQWLQAYEIAPENVWSILGTLNGVFKSVHVFSPAQARSDLLLVARNTAHPPDWQKIRERISAPQTRQELSLLGIRGPADIAVRLLAGPKGVSELSRHSVHNTDDNARIEFATPWDLIDYSQYSTLSIVKRLQHTLGDPVRAFSAVAPGSREDLCWADLRAGSLWEKTLVKKGRGNQGASTCPAMADLMGAKVDPPGVSDLQALLGDDPRRVRAAQIFQERGGEGSSRLAALFVDTDNAAERYQAYCLLGHYSALEKRHFHALSWLFAARMLDQGQALPYPPLSRLLASELSICGQYPSALEILLHPMKGTRPILKHP